jgi:hypothetical protein
MLQYQKGERHGIGSLESLLLYHDEEVFRRMEGLCTKIIEVHQIIDDD